MRDQLVAEATTYTTHKTQERDSLAGRGIRTSYPTNRTYAFDRPGAGMSFR
jgi:hypothetical protein